MYIQNNVTKNSINIIVLIYPFEICVHVVVALEDLLSSEIREYVFKHDHLYAVG